MIFTACINIQIGENWAENLYMTECAIGTCSTVCNRKLLRPKIKLHKIQMICTLKHFVVLPSISIINKNPFSLLMDGFYALNIQIRYLVMKCFSAVIGLALAEWETLYCSLQCRFIFILGFSSWLYECRSHIYEQFAQRWLNRCQLLMCFESIREICSTNTWSQCEKVSICINSKISR